MRVRVERASLITIEAAGRAHAVVLRKLGRTLARESLLSGGLPVIVALPSEETDARVLLASHIDKDWTLCDAISFSVMKARRVARAFTFDYHFRQVGRFEVLGLPE